MSTTKYPTEPENLSHQAMPYRVWKNDDNWWVANAIGREWHGATRADVESLAKEAIDEYMDDDENWPSVPVQER